MKTKWLCICCVLCLFCLACAMSGAEGLDEAGMIGEASFYSREEGEVCFGSEEGEVLPGAKVSPSMATGTDGPSADTADEPDSSQPDTTGTRDFVYRMYTIVLNRVPDEGGLNYWVDKLESGELGAADIVAGFFNSEEYVSKNKSSAEIVTDCYQAMLNRGPDEGGKLYWMQRLDVGMTADVVCAGFLGSTEFQDLAASYGIRPGSIALNKARDQNYLRTAFVYRLYKECLGRTPDSSGLEYWCSQLNAGMEGSQVAYGFVFSDEYKSKIASNRAYLEMLYRTFLGRPSEPSGMDYWENRLNYVNTRENVMNGFMFSNEFAGMCAEAGLTVGSPIGEPDGTAEWQANIQVLELINQERAAEGLNPLITREDLWERVAMVRAEEVKTLFSHTRPDGTSCYTAYEEGNFYDMLLAGENIAYGYSTPAAVMNAWMNSPGHRANILYEGYTTVATGLYPYYNWSQNFYTGWND